MILFFSCKKDKPPVRPIQNTNTSSNTSNNRILVSNEGTFNYSNSSVSEINTKDNSVIEDLYKQSNQSSLGDVLQSITFYGDYAYLAVNNSNKIEVVRSNDFKRVATITNLSSPRYLLPVSNNKAYVTDLYANQISIINLNTNIKTGTIPCKGWTENLILLNNMVYVTNYHSDYLYVINPTTDLISDSILISKGAQSIVADKNNNVWIGCSSDQFNQFYGALYCINPITKQMVFKYTPGNYNFNADDLIIDQNGENIYYSNHSLYKQNIYSSNINSTPLVKYNGRNIYGFNIDFSSNTLYLCDAHDFVQRGQLIKINLSNGALTDSINVGISPNMVYFK
jgi:YVTN family beta-propeller protein